MFIKTIRVRKPNLLAAALVAVIVCIIAVLVVTAYRFAKPAVYEMKSESQRQEFLTSMGWEVSKEFDECKVVIIPEEFNEVYLKYNDMQKKQGFDLSCYKGKTCEVYTYKIKNYKGHEDKDDVNCNLIVCENQLIGGDVCSTELDGFMQGLKSSQK